MYYGQPLGVVVADSQHAADKGAAAVQVAYNSISSPVISVDDAIAAKTQFPPTVPEIVVGTPDRALFVGFRLIKLKLFYILTVRHEFCYNTDRQPYRLCLTSTIYRYKS